VLHGVADGFVVW